MSDNYSEWNHIDRYSDRAKYANTAIVKHHGKRVGENDPDSNIGTMCRVECYHCGNAGTVVAWHGWNSFYECPDCNSGVKVIG